MVPFLPPISKKPRSFLTQNRLIFTTMNDNPWKYQPSKKKKRCSALRYKYFTIIKKCQTLLFKFESPDTELSNMNYIFFKNPSNYVHVFEIIKKANATYIWLKCIESRCVHFWPDWYHSSTCNRCSFFTKKWRMNTLAHLVIYLVMMSWCVLNFIYLNNLQKKLILV